MTMFLRRYRFYSSTPPPSNLLVPKLRVIFKIAHAWIEHKNWGTLKNKLNAIFWHLNWLRIPPWRLPFLQPFPTIVNREWAWRGWSANASPLKDKFYKLDAILHTHLNLLTSPLLPPSTLWDGGEIESCNSCVWTVHITIQQCLYPLVIIIH